jgi:uncharacterized protein YaaN involved in tellurite resistance
LNDISTYRQEALPRLKSTIDSFQEMVDMGNEQVEKLEKEKDIFN